MRVLTEKNTLSHPEYPETKIAAFQSPIYSREDYQILNIKTSAVIPGRH